MHLVHPGCSKVLRFQKTQGKTRELSWQRGTGTQVQARDRYHLHKQKAGCGSWAPSSAEGSGIRHQKEKSQEGQSTMVTGPSTPRCLLEQMGTRD